MTPIKAIAVSRINDQQVNEGYSLELFKNRIREYANYHSLEIVKEYAIHENCTWGESLILKKILESIDKDKETEKYTIITYSSEEFPVETEITKLFRELTSTSKLESRCCVHPCFKEPADPATKIWRYIDLPKFLDLLQTNSLYFARADFLRKSDKFEGSYFTKFTREVYTLLARNMLQLPNSFQIPKDKFLDMQNQMDNHNEQIALKQMFINCWHISNFENFAMWRIYSDVFGICIQTTFEKLRKSFRDTKWHFQANSNAIFIGKVIYIDRETMAIPQGNGFWPFIHKGVEFDYEKELRCIIWNTENFLDVSNAPNHFKLSVNLEDLIERIYISPLAPSWFKSSVTALCEKYGLKEDIIYQSSLS